MIPKKIHYCWFGDKDYPDNVKYCIETWKHYLGSYEFIEWSEKNFNINSNLFTKQAYEAEKYAFVSDYVRLHALYEYGGIYLDTDVEVLKPFDDLLSNKAFTGFESKDYIAPWILATEPKNEIFKEFLSYYNEKLFYTKDGKMDMTSNPKILTNICSQYGLIRNNKKQTIKSLTVYPTTYFCPWKPYQKKKEFSSNTYTIHHFSASWMTEKQRLLRKKSYYRFFEAIAHFGLKALGEKNYMKIRRRVKL